VGILLRVVGERKSCRLRMEHNTKARGSNMRMERVGIEAVDTYLPNVGG